MMKYSFSLSSRVPNNSIQKGSDDKNNCHIAPNTIQIKSNQSLTKKNINQIIYQNPISDPNPFPAGRRKLEHPFRTIILPSIQGPKKKEFRLTGKVTSRSPASLSSPALKLKSRDCHGCLGDSLSSKELKPQTEPYRYQVPALE